MNNKIAVIAHNIRSGHNIGSLFRTCDGLGTGPVLLTGYSPYPVIENDSRLPHIALNAEKLIHKTALGAEKTVGWSHYDTAEEAIEILKDQGYKIIALEQSENSINLPDYRPETKIAILLGSEVDGISTELMELADTIIEIPMLGAKESFNVSEAATMAMFHFRYHR